MKDKLSIAILPMALGAFSAALDNNVLNICLPPLAKEFETDLGTVQFVSSSYVFAICSLLLFFAYLSAAIGRKYVFSIGVTLFSLGSLAAAFSPNIFMLILFRIIQGIGAAMFMANGMALINSHFSNEVKGRAFGIIFTATSVASIIGPVVGGAIATMWGWRAIFFLITPVAALAGVLAIKLLNKEDQKPITSFDLKGSVLSILGVFAFFSSFYLVKSRYPSLALLALVGAISLFYFFRNSQRESLNPVLNPKIWGQKNFLQANMQSGMIFAIMMAVSVVLPFYFHAVFGYSSAYSGMVLATMALSIVAVSYYSGFLADKLGTQKITALGIKLVLFGMMTLLIGVYVKLNWLLILGNLILGAGIGIFNPANNKMIMQSVPNEFAAMAASINVLSRNAGIAIGIALSGMGYSAFISFHLRPDLAAAGVLGVFLILNVFVQKIKVR